MADWFETRFREPADAGQLDPAFVARMRALVVEEWHSGAETITSADIDHDGRDEDTVVLETEDRPTGHEPTSPRRRSPGRWLLVATAAAVLAVVGTLLLVAGGDETRIDTVTPPPTTAPPGTTEAPTTTVASDDPSPLERIRAQGRLEGEQVTESGIRVRTYVLCDGSPECSPDTDGPIRREHESYAIEVAQDADSALFRIGNSAMTVVTEHDDTTVLVMDPLVPTLDALDPNQNSYRLVRADGTEIPLQMDASPAPAVPSPGVVLINHYDIDPDTDSMASQTVLLVDEDDGTVRALEAPPVDGRRTWGPNVDEFLWLVTFSCDVHFWMPNGSFELRDPGCTEGFDPGHYQTDELGNVTDDFGNPGNGDITWVNGDWFPDGWLEPGRMAFLERNFLGRDDVRFTLHVTLDQGSSWQQIPVSDEAEIPGALRQLG